MDMTKLAKSNMENIVKEIKSHSQMKHKHIVDLVDHVQDGDNIYILQDFADNGNLFTYMNKVDVGHATICKIFVQVCLAIEHIHSKGYIHRDLKPENIFLDKNMNALLGDFGWCAHVSDTTYRYQTAGTYEYMSPEALKGRIQGREVDLWALGVLLYELFHDQEPFPGKSSNEVLDSIQTKAVEFFSDVPKEATDLMVKILAIDPKKRPSIRDIFKHPFIAKFYHEPLPPAPTGVENFPQSPVSSRHASPIRNRLNTVAGSSTTSNRVIQISTGGVENSVKMTPSLDDKSPMTRPRNNTTIEVIKKQTPFSNELKLYPNSTSQRTIPSSRIIEKNPEQQRVPTTLQSASSMRVMPVMNMDTSPSSPLRHPPRPPIITMINRVSYQNDKTEASSPTRIISGPPSFPRPPTITNTPTRNIQDAMSPSKFTTGVYKTESIPESGRLSPMRVVTQGNSNHSGFTAAAQVTQQYTSQAAVPTKVFNFGMVDTVDRKFSEPTLGRDSYNQFGQPKIVISSNKDITPLTSLSNDSRNSPRTTHSQNSVNPLNTRLGQNNLISLHTANMHEKSEPTQVIANSPITTFEKLKPIQQTYDRVLPPTFPINITIPRIPEVQIRTMETKQNLRETTPPERYGNEIQISTERGAQQMARDYPSGNGSPTTGPFRKIVSAFQGQTTKNTWFKEAGTFETHTNDSTSTDVSRRVVINSHNLTQESLQAFNAGLRQVITIASKTPQASVQQPTTYPLSDKRDAYVQRRPSYGHVISSGSPKKDEIISTVGRVVQGDQVYVNRGIQSRVEPLRLQDTTNTLTGYTPNNGNLGTPLLRLSPNRQASNTADYSSFFMKKICSIDSNCSSEYDLSQASIKQIRPRADSYTNSNSDKPDLAKAMTAVVVGSDPTDRNQTTTGIT